MAWCALLLVISVRSTRIKRCKVVTWGSIVWIPTFGCQLPTADYMLWEEGLTAMQKYRKVRSTNSNPDLGQLTSYRSSWGQAVCESVDKRQWQRDHWTTTRSPRTHWLHNPLVHTGYTLPRTHWIHTPLYTLDTHSPCTRWIHSPLIHTGYNMSLNMVLKSVALLSKLDIQRWSLMTR